MGGRAEVHEIVATSKGKHSKTPRVARQRQRQQRDDTVDEWDAESSDDDSNTGTKQQDVFKTSKDQWIEANSQAPAAVPLVASAPGRSLPDAAYGHCLQSNPGAQAPAALPSKSGITIARAPPRILQRPKEAAPGIRSDGVAVNASKAGSQEHKTVEQRRHEYRLARERIFGAPSKPTSFSSKNSLSRS